MTQRRELRVLSISQYGAGLAHDGARYSGAFERQKDYARTVSRYTVLVPGSSTSSTPPVPGEEALSIHTVKAGNPIAFSLGAYSLAVQLHEQEPFHAVMVDNPHLGGLLGARLKKRLGIPLVVHSMADMLGNPWYRRERLSNRPKHFLMRLAFRAADVFRVSTGFERERLAASGRDIRKICVVPFYIERGTFEEALARAPGERRPNSVLFVGRMGPQKDVPTLIRAFQRTLKSHPQARLTLVGGGPALDSARSLAGSLQTAHAIDFTGPIPYERIASAYKTASVFVMPSLYEGTCMVFHEAAAAGLPIVSTDTAGARDFIVPDNSPGKIVPVRDPNALGDAISAMIDNESYRARCGDNARRRLDAFSKGAALAAFERLIDAVAPGSKPPGPTWR